MLDVPLDPSVVTYSPRPLGKEILISWLLPDRMYARRLYKIAIKKHFSQRPWPEKPLIVILPSGTRYRVFQDGQVQDWDKAVAALEKAVATR